VHYSLVRAAAFDCHARDAATLGAIGNDTTLDPRWWTDVLDKVARFVGARQALDALSLLTLGNI
jgi:hypothetical protein